MSTQEILDEIDIMLSTNLMDNERELLTKMRTSLNYYKSLIPKDLKKDIVELLKMATKYKLEHDELSKPK